MGWLLLLFILIEAVTIMASAVATVVNAVKVFTLTLTVAIS